MIWVQVASLVLQAFVLIVLVGVVGAAIWWARTGGTHYLECPLLDDSLADEVEYEDADEDEDEYEDEA